MTLTRVFCPECGAYLTIEWDELSPIIPAQIWGCPSCLDPNDYTVETYWRDEMPRSDADTRDEFDATQRAGFVLENIGPILEVYDEEAEDDNSIENNIWLEEDRDEYGAPDVTPTGLRGKKLFDQLSEVLSRARRTKSGHVVIQDERIFSGRRREFASMHDLEVGLSYAAEGYELPLRRSEIDGSFTIPPHVEEIVAATNVSWLFGRRETLFTLGGLKQSEKSALAIDLMAVNAELIRYLAAHPNKMYELHPRKFEELVAELLRGMGYEVTLTPPSRDGGKDILALRKEPFGHILTYVECKRHAPDRSVGVELIRALYGVVRENHASHGVLASTSFFTKGAREMATRLRYELSLADYATLSDWCRNIDALNARRHR